MKPSIPHHSTKEIDLISLPHPYGFARIGDCFHARFHLLNFFLFMLIPAGGFTAENQGLAEPSLFAQIDRLASQVEPEVIAWRRDIHRHPELSNREFWNSQLVAEQLKSFGLEVQTGVAHTGMLGSPRGAKDSPVVALRADMGRAAGGRGGGPAVRVRGKIHVQRAGTGVMHACGHDAHTAILLGVAKIFAQMRDRIPGTIKFIFQPAQEDAPEGEESGEELMIKQGVLENPKPGAIFGLHVYLLPTGSISYRPGPAAASSDTLAITIHVRQTHGARTSSTPRSFAKVLKPVSFPSSRALAGLEAGPSMRATIMDQKGVWIDGTQNGG